MCHLYPYKNVKLLWKLFYINSGIDPTHIRIQIRIPDPFRLKCWRLRRFFAL